QLGATALAHPRPGGLEPAWTARSGGAPGGRAGALTEDVGRLIEEPADPARPLRSRSTGTRPREVEDLPRPGHTDVHQSPLLLDLLGALGHHDRHEPIGTAGEEDD